MIGIKKKIRCRITLQWEENGICPPEEADGYILTDGTIVVEAGNQWEGVKVVYETVFDADELIGFIPTDNEEIRHIGRIKALADKV